MQSDLSWEDLLPTHLKKSAYKGGTEFAWRRSDAIEVLKFLSNKEYVLLGVDVWLATEPGPTIPTPFVYDWFLETSPLPSPQRVSTLDFIRQFKWDPADKNHQEAGPYFSITAIRRDS